jgi:hypothetical protein
MMENQTRKLRPVPLGCHAEYLHLVGDAGLNLAWTVCRWVVGPELFSMPLYSRDWAATGPREVLADGAPRCRPPRPDQTR